MRLAVLLNAGGGTFRTLDMDAFSQEAESILVEAGHEVTIERAEGGDIIAAMERLAEIDGLDAMIIGGGDGTISAAAGMAFRKGIPIGIVPAGTMNLFARALQMPMEPMEAIRALADGEIRKVDIATANDRPFVHQISVGLHARLVRLRNARDFTSRRGKIAATFAALLEVIRNPPSFRVITDAGDGPRERTVSAVQVSNDRLNNQPMPYADVLDEGVLGLYHARAMTPTELMALAFDAVRQRMQSNPSIEVSVAEEVLLTFPRLRRGSNAVIDGELVPLEKEVRIRCHKGALSVLAPRQE